MACLSKMSVNIAVGMILEKITSTGGYTSVLSNASPQVVRCLTNINSGALSAGIFIDHIATNRRGYGVLIFKKVSYSIVVKENDTAINLWVEIRK